MIVSPLTGKGNVVRVKSIESDFIISNYREILNVDVSSFFEGQERIYIYKCLDTGYRFYSPNIEGDNLFYESLQHFPWYYLPWRWEHEIAERWIKTGDSVLEIGCGRGDFMRRMKDKGALCTGLEMNASAVQAARGKGLDVSVSSLGEHAKSNKEKYDVVCAFEVLEHIAEVGEFLNVTLRVLKKGGKLVVGVPNNDSYIKHIANDVLNMPPHHQGLWGADSLTALSIFFSIRLEKIYLEPLQALYQVDKYYATQLSRRAVGKILRMFPKTAIIGLFRKMRYFINGDSIIAVYTKST